jgi:hypothetical protein
MRTGNRRLSLGEEAEASGIAWREGPPSLSEGWAVLGEFQEGVGSWEPRLWEEPRKTTEGSPRGVAPSAGRQMPSNGRRMGDGIVRGVKA